MQAVQANVNINKRFEALRARCPILAVQHPIRDWGRSLGKCAFSSKNLFKKVNLTNFSKLKEEIVIYKNSSTVTEIPSKTTRFF